MVGKVIDGSSKAGANHIDRIEFSLKDDQSVRAQALQRATTAAKKNAESIAAALGVSVTGVAFAETSETGAVRPLMGTIGAMRAEAKMQPTQIESGNRGHLTRWLRVTGAASIRKEFRMPTPAQAKEDVNASIRSLQEHTLRRHVDLPRGVRHVYGRARSRDVFRRSRIHLHALACRSEAALARKSRAGWRGRILPRTGVFLFSGPLTVLPQLWDRQLPQALLAPTIELFDQGRPRAGSAMFSNSPSTSDCIRNLDFGPDFYRRHVEARNCARNFRSEILWSPRPVLPGSKRAPPTDGFHLRRPGCRY